MGPLSELGGVESLRKHPLLPRDEFGQPIPTSFSEIKSLLNFLGDSPSPTERVQSGNSALSTQHSKLQQRFARADTSARAGEHAAGRYPGPRRDRAKPCACICTPTTTAPLRGSWTSLTAASTRPCTWPGAQSCSKRGCPLPRPTTSYGAAYGSLCSYTRRYCTQTDPDPSTPGAFFRYVCLVESTGRSTGLRQMFTQVEGQERVLQIRWETAVRGPGPGPSFGPGGMSQQLGIGLRITD